MAPQSSRTVPNRPGDETNSKKPLQSSTSVAENSGQSEPSTFRSAGGSLRFVQPSSYMEAAPVGKLHKSDAVANTAANDSSNNSSSGNNTGPLQCTWTVPKRVKPGRKPATDNPPTKRKAQNRAAQRAYRERKAARIDTLEDEKQQIRDEFKQLESRYQNKIIQAVQNVRVGLEKDVAYWKDKAERLERMLEMECQDRVSAQTSASGNYQGVDMMSPTSTLPLTPTSNGATSNAQDVDPCLRCGEDGRCPCLEKYTAVANDENADNTGKIRGVEDAWSILQATDMPGDRPMETFIPVDFTHYNTVEKSKRVEANVKGAQEENCGFCANDGICICKSELAKDMERKEEKASDRNSLMSTNIKPTSLAAARTRQRSKMNLSPKMSPGTCKDCQSNPQQKKICQKLARERPLLPSASRESLEKTTSHQNLARGPTSSHHGTVMQESMPCSQFFRLFKERSISMDPDRSQWMHNVYTIPNNQRDNTTGTSISDDKTVNAAYEIAAANILATLNQASQESKSFRD